MRPSRTDDCTAAASALRQVTDLHLWIFFGDVHPPADRVKLLPKMETTERKLPIDQIFKFVAIGDVAVGKSCLLMQFTDQKFRPGLDPTIGVESSSRIVTIDDDTPTKLQISDITGQEAFRCRSTTSPGGRPLVTSEAG